MSKIKKIGVLTSGGDAPGMNAAIRAVTRLGLVKGIEVIGINKGYQGLIDNNMAPLHERDVSYIINRGGTMLYTARCDEFKTPEGIQKAVDVCRLNEIDGIIAIGGDGTFRGAADLCEAGIPCIGIPGTIDNDIAETDMTIGFDTAMNTVVELVDKIRDTGESHSRCNVIEVMGREAGDIALQTSIAVGAITALIKEAETDLPHVIEKMKEARLNGKRNFIIILCEGMGKNYGTELVEMLQRETGIETRYSCLGYIQRGGSPTLRDRVLATQMGCSAVECMLLGDYNKVICSRGNSIVAVDIKHSILLEKLMKNKLSQEEIEQIPPSSLYEMKRIIADRKAYKIYLNDIIDQISL